MKFKSLPSWGILFLILPFSFSASWAGQDWVDRCTPDVAALAQAARDFPSDRFDRSACADSVYRRGTCSVEPRESAGRDEEQVTFDVRIKNNRGTERSYVVAMRLDTACRVVSVQRRGAR